MVAGQILQQIEAGELLPGSLLPSQRELAELLGVGRSSVREAVNALMVMGYLLPKQGKGTFVSEPLPGSDSSLEKLGSAFQAGSILDLMEARELLECKSAALAAERADASQTNRLKRCLKKLGADHTDYNSFLNADIRFHTAVAEAAGNPVMGEMTKFVLDKVIFHHSRLKTQRLTKNYRKISIKTAHETVNAIESGNAKQASARMADHLGAIKDELKLILQ